MDALRQALNTPAIPFIAGGIGDFLGSGRYGRYFTEYTEVNRALQQYAQTKPNAYFVTSN